MMAGYSRLLWREVRPALPVAIAYVAGILLWSAFLGTRVGRWPDGVVLAMAQTPLWTLPPWALWRMFHGLRNDLDTPHAYLLLSLPVPGWQLASAKVLVVWAELAMYAAAAAVGLASVFKAAGVPGLPPGLSAGQVQLFEQTLVYAMVLLLLLLLGFGAPAWLVLAQAAWSAGHAVRRARGLVMAMAFLAGLWLLLRAAIAGGAVLGALPGWALLPYPDVVRYPGGSWAVEPKWLAIHPGPLIGVAVAAVAGFFASARWIEHALDEDSPRGVLLAGVVAGFAVAVIDVYLHGAVLVDRLLEALLP